MAAPSNIVWGSIVNSKAKLGISVTETSITSSTVYLHIEVWLALRWNINDSSNTLTFTYTDGGSSTGYSTITQNNLALNFGTTSGSGWSESASQQKVFERDDSWSRVSTNRTLEFSSSLGPLAGEAYTVSASTTYTVPAQSVTTHIVSYDANGGSGAPSSQTKVYGSILTLSSTIPTRNQYNFVTWNTARNGSGTNRAPGSLYGEDVDVTLYAQWSPWTHTLRYDLNGGTGNFPDQTQTTGNVVTMHSGIPTRTGYTFLGWYFDADGNGRILEPGHAYHYVQNGGVAMLTAQWEINVYTITFNANGGYGAPSPQEKTHGVNLTLSSITPSRAGYTFKGWGNSSSTTTVSYQPGGTYSNNANITLYAIWEVLFNEDFVDINLYLDGTCYAREYIEDDSFYIDKYGILHANEFIEQSSNDGLFFVDSNSSFTAVKFVEGELVKLVDDLGNLLIDENGNYLVCVN